MEYILFFDEGHDGFIPHDKSFDSVEDAIIYCDVLGVKKDYIVVTINHSTCEYPKTNTKPGYDIVKE